MSKSAKSSTDSEDNTYNIRMQKYRVACDPNVDSNFRHKRIWKQIKESSLKAKAMWVYEHQLGSQLQQQVQELEKNLQQLQKESSDTKRSRWCCNCEDAATYNVRSAFFCSKICELKRQETLATYNE